MVLERRGSWLATSTDGGGRAIALVDDRGAAIGTADRY
jgi:hypothetical protein